MDPRSIERNEQVIHKAMMLAMHKLESEYVNILIRCGCKQITLYRV